MAALSAKKDGTRLADADQPTVGVLKQLPVSGVHGGRVQLAAFFQMNCAGQSTGGLRMPFEGGRSRRYRVGWNAIM